MNALYNQIYYFSLFVLIYNLPLLLLVKIYLLHKTFNPYFTMKATEVKGTIPPLKNCKDRFDFMALSDIMH